jgi:low temperature requirement protein LtrA
MHLRPRGAGTTQPVTTVELFFDLVFVFAITQLSHRVLDDLTLAGILRAGFLLLIVWWAWINTTWLTNWLDPGSPRVRLLLVAVALASLVLAAAIPRALRHDSLLFAVSYVVLQSGRNLGAVLLSPRDHQLRLIFARLLFWSVLVGGFWIAGGLVDPSARLLVWGAALAIDLLSPVLGYPTPRLGRSRTDDYDIEGGHFAERCQGFIIIALGESVVVTGATASAAGLGAQTVAALVLAFAATAALWWLYFDAVADYSRRDLAASPEAGRLARDAYTYLHVLIVAGVIALAVGADLLLADPGHALSGAGVAMLVGGPVLFLVGESLFRLRMIGSLTRQRPACIALLVLAGLVVAGAPALALAGAVVALLGALALWEQFGIPA